jgi:hypothetical protein
MENSHRWQGEDISRCHWGKNIKRMIKTEKFERKKEG